MAKQFPEVSSKYGAPLGRASFGTPEQSENKIRLFRVRLDAGGYDDGGAYWGTGSKALYCATDGADYREFIRADSRLQAVVGLGLERGLMASPPLKAFYKLMALEAKGCISASGVLLRQDLEALGFQTR